MRFILVLLMCLSLGACALTPAPEPIQQGTAAAAQLAVMNQNNVKAINEQYYNGFKTLVQGLIKRESERVVPDGELLETYAQYLASLEQLYARLKETAYPVTDFQVELTQALAAWGAEPGIELSRLVQIITNGAILLQNQ